MADSGRAAEFESDKAIGTEVTVYEESWALSVGRCLDLVEEWKARAKVFEMQEKYDEQDDAGAKERTYLALAAIGPMDDRNDALGSIDWMMENLTEQASRGCCEKIGLYVHFLTGLRELIVKDQLGVDRIVRKEAGNA